MKKIRNILIILMLIALIGAASARIIDNRNIIEKLIPLSIPGSEDLKFEAAWIKLYVNESSAVAGTGDLVIYTGKNAWVPLEVDAWGIEVTNTDPEGMMSTVSISGLDGTLWGQQDVRLSRYSDQGTRYKVIVPVFIPDSAAGATYVDIKQVTTTSVGTYESKQTGKIAGDRQINAKIPAVTTGQPSTSAAGLVSIVWDFIRSIFGLI